MMQSGAVVGILEATGSPDACFRALAESLNEMVPLRRAAWIAGTGAPRTCWPAPFKPGDDVMERAAEAAAAGATELRRGDQARTEDGSDALIVPCSSGAASPAAVVLLAEGGVFGGDTQEIENLVRTFGRVTALIEQAREAERRCDELRRRAEETEALHTLGLGINRSLDPGAVAPLVARLARTLLAGQYALVYVRQDERLRLAARVGSGLDDRPAEAGDDLERAAAAGHPVAFDLERGDEVPEAERRSGAVAAAVAPMTLYGRSVGAVIVGYRGRPALTDRDLRLAAMLASHAAIAISNAQLHHDLTRRTGELEEANAAMERLSSVKERFFASMNHELRTPVSAIMGFNQLLLDRKSIGELPEKAEHYVKRSQSAAAGLLTLVNDILDLSKIAAGKMRLDPQQFLVSDLVEQITGMMRPLADGKGIELEYAVSSSRLTLDTDLTRVRQVLLNLVTNALKFTDGGHVRIEVEDLDAASRFIEIRVSDTGCGIAPENLDRIFDEFEQAVDADSQHGTGLGLPISRRLAHLLGGDLTAESEPGQGSTFRLRIPRVLRADASPESVSSHEAVPAS